MNLALAICRHRLSSELMAAARIILGPRTSTGEDGSGERQNLGQGLRVFKCTIGALTQGQGEFTKMVCRLLKYLKKRKIQLIAMNRAISVFDQAAGSSDQQSIWGPTWLNVWEPQNIMWFKDFGKCERFLFWFMLMQKCLTFFQQSFLQCYPTDTFLLCLFLLHFPLFFCF